MKTDKNGCSTTKKGEERIETFYSPKKIKLFQYDYRHNETGELFSCVGQTLAECRRKKDDWLTAQKPLKETVYYQPVLTEREMFENDMYSWFVYRSLENAKRDFPNHKIKEYSGNDIEEPVYIDDVDFYQKLNRK
jgi:hypothetical protein